MREIISVLVDQQFGHDPFDNSGVFHFVYLQNKYVVLHNEFYQAYKCLFQLRKKRQHRVFQLQLESRQPFPVFPKPTDTLEERCSRQIHHRYGKNVSILTILYTFDNQFFFYTSVTVRESA